MWWIILKGDVRRHTSLATQTSNIMKARELRLGHSKQIRKYARSKVSGPLQSQVSSKRSSRGKDTTLALKAKIRRHCLFEAQVETISSGQTHSAQTTSQIHRPSKGSAGDGFNLQVEMGLEDDDRSIFVQSTQAHYSYNC